ncbi:hypothetical protein BJF86_13230 [Serinicoccus sp. CNJ-927]|uniref:hypothetical protein n=1 Tax=Serinicoccus sp. CNJ-927 TaxID=1904970 RepID=UPI0009595252|nr:hypothetical protein [Serinicoccus sp. CNJ-927]OLT43917.1 hypothetical protein BJF86_13230 [Serinicoccus sp. CNJ-927]
MDRERKPAVGGEEDAADTAGGHQAERGPADTGKGKKARKNKKAAKGKKARKDKKARTRNFGEGKADSDTAPVLWGGSPVEDITSLEADQDDEEAILREGPSRLSWSGLGVVGFGLVGFLIIAGAMVMRISGKISEGTLVAVLVAVVLVVGTVGLVLSKGRQMPSIKLWLKDMGLEAFWPREKK